MALSFLSRLIHRNTRDLFLGVVLYEDHGRVCAFEHTDPEVSLLAESSFTYSDSFDHILDDVDKAVYKLEKKVSFSFKRALFIVPSIALAKKGQELAQPYRSAIADIVRNMEFEAMGYVEFVDTLKHELEQTHSNAYVEVGKQDALIIFNRGSVRWKTVSVKAHVANIATHLDEFLSKGTPVFINSLHTGIKTDQLIATMSSYQAVACTTHMQEKGLINLLTEQLSAPAQKEDVRSQEEASAEEPSEEVMDDALIVDAQPAVVVDGDAHKQGDIPLTDRPEAKDSQTTSEDSLGFAIVSELDEEPIRPPASSEGDTFVDEVVSVPIQNAQTQDEIEREGKELDTTEGEWEDSEESTDEIIKDNTRPSVLAIVRSISVLFIAGLSAVLLGLLTIEFLWHRVTVQVQVPTETISLEAAIADIPLTKLVEEKEVDVRVQTTGTKEVGDRAKGKVILASFDDKQASFSAGTKLIYNGSPYQLDEDVTLPGASLDTTSGTKSASKKTVSASALFIGPEGNIEKGKQFKVADYAPTLYYALSENTFSGGSKRTVSVVSNKDIQAVRAMVISKGKEASESAHSSSSQESVVLDEISTVDTDDVQYSANAGEITSSLVAKGTVRAQLYAVDKQALINRLKPQITQQKGASAMLADTETTFVFDRIEVAKDERTVSLSVKATMRVFEQPDAAGIKQAIVLLPVSQATARINTQYGIDSVTYTFNPVLPLFDSFMPVRASFIDLQVSPKE